MVGAGHRARARRPLQPALLLLVLMAVPTASAAPFLQHQGGPTRTGAVDDPGPEGWDIAFKVPLPGGPAARSSLVVLDGSAYVLVQDRTVFPVNLSATPPDVSDDPLSRLGANALVRVNLSTATVEELVTFDRAPTAMASDGEHLFIAGPDAFAAYPLDGGEPTWSWPYFGTLGTSATTVCIPPAIVAQTIYTACERYPAEALDELLPVSSAFAVALDTATGEPRWLWAAGSDRFVALEPLLTDTEHPSPFRFEPNALAVLGNRVVVVGRAAPHGQPYTFPNDPRQAVMVRAIGLDAESGDHVWTIDQNPLARAPTSQLANTPPHGAVTGDDELAYVLGYDLQAVDLEDGSTRWTWTFEEIEPGRSTEPRTLRTFTGSGLALRGGVLYATAYSGLHAVDVTLGQPQARWLSPLPRSDWEGTHSLLTTPDHVYAGTYELDPLIFERETGRLVFSEIDPPGNDADGLRIAMADGLAVITGWEWDQLLVLGTTPASIQLSIGEVDAYPAVGDTVVVDARGSRAGVQSDRTEYRVDWGDGEATDWTEDPHFEHTYETAGEVQMVVLARNDAGQTASRVTTLDVGGTPPPDPTFLEQAFARDNQDLTFGVLGILVALTGGAVALSRQRLHKNRLQRELKAINEVYGQLQDRPAACEAALNDRRARIQNLLADGELDEHQFHVLDRRLEELHKDIRLGTLDTRFQYLPHGMVMTLKDMLADGKITAWEHEHLVEALERDTLMTGEQKSKLRDLIDAWYGRDAGGGE